MTTTNFSDAIRKKLEDNPELALRVELDRLTRVNAELLAACKYAIDAIDLDVTPKYVASLLRNAIKAAKSGEGSDDQVPNM